LKGSFVSAFLLEFFLLFVAMGNLANYFDKIDLRGRKQITLLAALGRKLQIRPILWEGLAIVLVFASLYFTLSIQTAKSFNVRLNILDSVYFSVVTMATVGFGDILPVSAWAKLLCMGQILFGYIYMVIVLATVITVWQRHHVTEPEESRDDAVSDSLKAGE
jgi:hypothetical protein